MPQGPGKYDALATDVREQSHARGVIVIVIDGNQGSGFSVQADADLLGNLPSILENVAREIRTSGH